jgi:hypothetical protein
MITTKIALEFLRSGNVVQAVASAQRIICDP